MSSTTTQVADQAAWRSGTADAQRLRTDQDGADVQAGRIDLNVLQPIHGAAADG